MPAASSPAASLSSSSRSSASSSAGFGRRSEIRRAMLLRMVRRTLRLAGEPAMVKPARWRSVALVSFSVFLIRSGSSRSSKNMSRNSSRERVNSKASSPEPSGLPSEPPPPPPSDGRGISWPTTYSLLPGTMYSLRPVRREWRKDGSLIPLVGIDTFSPLPTSATLRLRNASWTAALSSALARAMKRWRLLRLLPLGFGRRSTMFMDAASYPASPRLVDPHIPLDEPAHLTLGVPPRDHAGEEFGVLLLGLRILLRAEADDWQQILDLAEHAPLDDLAQLLVGRPGRIAARVVGPCAQGELHHLVAEVLGIGDARRFLDLRELLIEQLPIHQLTGVRILVVLILDPGIGVGDIAVEQILPVIAVGFEIGLLDLVADELGVARRKLRLDEIEIFLLGLLGKLLAPDRLLHHVHQMDGIGGDFKRVEIERARQHLEGEARRDAVHALVDPGGVAILLHRLGARIGVLQTVAVIGAHLRIEVRVLVRLQTREHAEAREHLQRPRRARRGRQLAGLEQLLIDLALLDDAQAVRHLDDADAVDERLVVLVVLEGLPLCFVRVGEDDALIGDTPDILGAAVSSGWSILIGALNISTNSRMPWVVRLSPPE